MTVKTAKGHIIVNKIIEDDSRIDKIKSGKYRIGFHAEGPLEIVPGLVELERKETLVKFNTGIVKQIVDDADIFFSEKIVSGFKRMQLCHKTACILTGSPGTGKTSAANLAIDVIVDKYKAISIDATGVNSHMTVGILSSIRDNQDTPIVLFIDEIDNSIMENEELFLTLLDGNRSIDHLIVIGCTNYPNRIPDRILKRKSRIKNVYSVESLSFEVYKQYIREKVPDMEEKLVDKISYYAGEKRLVIDQVKNVLIDHVIHGIPIKSAINNSIKFYNPSEEPPKNTEEDWEFNEDE